MPAYEQSRAAEELYAGNTQAIVVSEQLGAGNFSERMKIAGSPNAISIRYKYASTPGAVQYDLYVANDDSIAPGVAGSDYYPVSGFSTTSVTGDLQDLEFDQARYVCVREVISPGVEATITVSV